MKNTVRAIAVSVALLLGTASQVFALSISPGSEIAKGNQTSNSQILTAVSGIIGFNAATNLLYKQNVGGGEEGTFKNSYATSFSGDPNNAIVSYTGGPIINFANIYFLVKDGSARPAWYLFNISSWNGTETINATNFWPGPRGAISYVSIIGNGTPSVPDGGTSAALLGSALLGLSLLRRRFGTR